jgi:sulfonate transport system ATP-binding protein
VAAELLGYMTMLSGLMDTAAVSVIGVERAFEGRTVLRGIDVSIEPGEFVALLGRSGSGKSTLLRILAGLDSGYTGTVSVPVRRSVVFQEPNLLPWSRVLSNIALGLRGKDVALRSRKALDEVGLRGHERAWPLTLSGGEAQRVALARALVREPALLLLDEPFGALDALTRIKMHGLLADLYERHRPAVLLVTHDVDEAIVLAERILVLGADGRICFDGKVEISRPRRRGDVAFSAWRTTLLGQLGVDESDEGR